MVASIYAPRRMRFQIPERTNRVISESVRPAPTASRRWMTPTRSAGTDIGRVAIPGVCRLVTLSSSFSGDLWTTVGDRTGLWTLGGRSEERRVGEEGGDGACG